MKIVLEVSSNLANKAKRLAKHIVMEDGIEIEIRIIKFFDDDFWILTKMGNDKFNYDKIMFI
jgi:hypothetical protein